MKKTLIVLSSLILVGVAAPAFAGARDPGINRRQHRQQVRIYQGICAGQLTRREAVRLERGEVRIARMERRGRADGRLTPRERTRLHRALNHQSRAIYRARHNNQQR